MALFFFVVSEEVEVDLPTRPLGNMCCFDLRSPQYACTCRKSCLFR